MALLFGKDEQCSKNCLLISFSFLFIPSIRHFSCLNYSFTHLVHLLPNPVVHLRNLSLLVLLTALFSRRPINRD